MATNRTFTMIKPDGVENGHIGNILAMITTAGFKIVSLKLTQLTIADARLPTTCRADACLPSTP